MQSVPSATPLTIGDWIHEAVARFEAAGLTYGHGTDNAWDEAVQAVLFAVDQPVDSDKSIAQKPVSAADAQKIENIIYARVHTRKPLPYLTQCAWFMGMPFYVDERALIPRSPFGEWITRSFSPWIDANRVQHILDIGTGTGCLAIGCATVFTTAQVDAVDVSRDALAVAAINIEQYQLADRVKLFLSDCFDALPQKRYDVIISNPPYVSAAEIAQLPAEYQHEPQSALLADDEGLALVERILRQAAGYLTDHGILLVEVGYTAETLAARYPEIPFVWLEQQQGGDGLFMLNKKQLEDYVRK